MAHSATNEASLIISIPPWVDARIGEAASLHRDEERMALAIALARENVSHGGGPFGAVVFDGDRLVSGGVNLVIASGLSIAHAEIVALSRAQQRLAFDVTHPEVERAAAELTLYTSAEPCCQCFGALVWSGVRRLVCAATREDVEAIGFDEGPKPAQWVDVLAERGITTTEGLLREESRQVLAAYAYGGGVIYGRR
jgi:tRNA(Arg) A34 adenosine deaminase TadA